MTDDNRALDVDQFIVEYIDSVPHLEALLLMWRTKPRAWSIAELAKELYLQPRQAESVGLDLARGGFVTSSGESFSYVPDGGPKDQLIADVDSTYRRETVRLATLVHTRGSRALRDFAQSFQLKKKKE